ncbi:MAG: UDP-N-acetylmuramoyl-L-alanyl-D-glutamate--2,6-diaminopimelate ligase [Oscillospiraceae bacterium]|jgi:UDP-N-acetylmuramoyl-L-alanyl-D-glutamate--2,6-diaminopimelate ligase|nr:UDP-N-acetylmuramoyl-L-alanyl-D-glutamate--2,6-diaminopimelate ligase [Oscillospiraceae bacterium]
MKLRDILKGIETVRVEADPGCEITDICYDSRRAAPGAMFAAVKGYETDGHRYMASAAEKGAAVVLCEQAPDCGVPYVLVRDSRLALALASANLFGRPAEKLKLIGVTGTNGKTTVTNLTRNIIESCTGRLCGLMGTNRNITGKNEYDAEHTTPESRDLQQLLGEMVEAGCGYAVMEVSSHSLMLGRVAGIRFTAGCFTNLSQDHLDFHGTMEAYLDAKAKLFDISENAVINADDPAAEKLKARAKGALLLYGIDSPAAELRAEDIKLLPDRVEFTAVYGDVRTAASLGIPGRFSVYNALAAVGCCIAAGVDPAEAMRALSGCGSVKGRMEVVPCGRDFTILIDYAVTPDALDNMIRTVRAAAPGRVVVLFGCGGDRDRTKRPKMGKVVAQLSDFAVVTSDNPRTEDPQAIIDDILPGFEGEDTPYVVIPDRRSAIRWAIEHARKDDTIVLTGKGHETYQIIGRTKHHMDEREIVAEILGG